MRKARNATAFPDAGQRRLAWACVVSLLFHALVLVTGRWLTQPHPQHVDAPPLQAVLLPPPPLPAPVLLVPEPVVPHAAPAAKPPRDFGRPVAAAGNVATMASRQIAEHLFYPDEAIIRGLEGEALVMLFLDEAGNAVAARLERSSGHAILDAAAVRAAREVRSLPAGAPQEVLLPVRFRLR